jgi:hypothetical protein
MRKIVYWLTVAILMYAINISCEERQIEPSLIPVLENDLLPSNNSLQKLPDW